jgi:hypothetical protein
VSFIDPPPFFHFGKTSKEVGKQHNISCPRSCYVEFDIFYKSKNTTTSKSENFMTLTMPTERVHALLKPWKFFNETPTLGEGEQKE